MLRLSLILLCLMTTLCAESSIEGIWRNTALDPEVSYDLFIKYEKDQFHMQGVVLQGRKKLWIDEKGTYTISGNEITYHSSTRQSVTDLFLPINKDMNQYYCKRCQRWKVSIRIKEDHPLNPFHNAKAKQQLMTGPDKK